MLTADEIAGMRATVTSALPDTGAITRKATSAGTIDGNGDFTPAAASSVYSGVMRVRTPDAAELETIFGDREITKKPYICTLPHNANGVKVDDQVVLSVSSDAQLVGVALRVTGVSLGSWELGRRIALESVE